MQTLTQEQWQFLWDASQKASKLNQLPIQDFLHELLTEQDFDVVGGAVVKLA
jgi:hypothetical protein